MDKVFLPLGNGKGIDRDRVSESGKRERGKAKRDHRIATIREFEGGRGITYKMSAQGEG